MVEGKGVGRGKKVTYLGYKFKRSEGQEGYVREKMKKAMGMMGQIWGIRKRRFGGDWKRRMELFD